ncbi:MAG TPA: four helix bundle protein [Paludibacter sp.]|nr:four helix bundle protein [Paludibacter sp.]
MKQTGNAIVDKSKAFAIRVIRLFQYLQKEKKEYIISKQLLRSGTSVGANIKEGIRGQSVKDFRAKMAIALKEASESEYWLELLVETDYIDQTQFESMVNDCIELIKILTAILNSSERNTVKEEIEPYGLIHN